MRYIDALGNRKEQMKRSRLKPVVRVVVACCLVIVLGEAWRESRMKQSVRKTFDFGEELSRRLASDGRFSSLQVTPSSANCIFIDGAVANTNLIRDLQEEIFSMNPPAKIYAELYLEGFKPNKTNNLVLYQWDIDPRGKQKTPVRKALFSERMNIGR